MGACLILAALLAVSVVAGAAERRPSLALQLSDLHFCRWGDDPFYVRAFGDREGDARLLASELVPSLDPSAILLTGDLTDGKERRGRGGQQRSEWESYAEFLGQLGAAAPGVPILDLRGNHDTFDVSSRSGPDDGYGRWLRDLSPPSTYAPTGGAGDAGSRVRVTQVGDAGAADGEDPCPAFVFLGVDTSPTPGLRSPANFAGRSAPELEAEAAGALEDALGARPRCPAPVAVAYGHYPPSTVARGEATDDGPIAAARLPLELALFAARALRAASGSASAAPGLVASLARAGASAYTSGHLHAAFGDTLRRLQVVEGDAGGEGGAAETSWLADIEMPAWKDDRRLRLLLADLAGTFSFLDAHFVPGNGSGDEPGEAGRSGLDPLAAAGTPSLGDTHDGPDPPPPVARRAGAEVDPAGGQGGPAPAPRHPPPRRVLARAPLGDLEWVAARLVRGWGLAPARTRAGSDVGPPARHIDALATITYPSDARYSAGAKARARGETTPPPGTVRALAVALPGAPAGALGVATLEARWADGSIAVAVEAVPAAGTPPGGPLLAIGVLRVRREEADARGERHLYVSVSIARAGGGGSSGRDLAEGGRGAAGSDSDDDGPAAARASNESARSVGIPLRLACDGGAWCTVASPGSPGDTAAIPRSLLERVTLAVNWPVVVQRMFYAAWAVLGGALLLAPAALAARALDDARRFPWPLGPAVSFARSPTRWRFATFYWGYLLVGPWSLAGSASSAPPTLVFHYGLLGRLPGPPDGLPSLRLIATPDTLFLTFVAICFAHAPYALWTQSAFAWTRSSAGGRGPAALAASDSATGAAAGPPRRPSLVAPVLLTLSFSLVFGFNYLLMYRRMPELMGWSSLAFSPGIAWAPAIYLAIALWPMATGRTRLASFSLPVPRSAGPPSPLGPPGDIPDESTPLVGGGSHAAKGRHAD